MEETSGSKAIVTTDKIRKFNTFSTLVNKWNGHKLREFDRLVDPDKQLDVLHHKGTDKRYMNTLVKKQVILNLVDTRYSNDIQRAIIGTMEVDMARNSGVIYMAPKMQMTVTDFAKHFQLIIKTRGYEDFTEGQNLAITKKISIRQRIPSFYWSGQVISLSNNCNCRLIKIMQMIILYLKILTFEIESSEMFSHALVLFSFIVQLLL
ncbi:hypothetical protein K1719_017722 [Acacia pycnantha]|nr:hypothetical protein K1719_017722 [Acacia pycnantha]